MTTPFSNVYDQFMMLVDDYNLITLFNTSVVDFETYLSGFLIPAITDFYNCNQVLTYSLGVFTETLSVDNIKVLAKLMKKYWLEREVSNITQMRLHVQDKDFKTFAEANNLATKEKVYSDYKEEMSQMLVDYGMNNRAMWQSFLNGNFYTP